MSKQNNSNLKVHMKKKTNVVNTENEFAAEFGEGLYGGQAREAFQQQQARKKNNLSK